MNNTLKEYQDLKKLAKANNIPTPVGIKNEDLKKLLDDKLKDTKENKQSEEVKYIEIPADLKHLSLTPVKIKTVQEVDLNNRLNTSKRLTLPKDVMEELKREGYIERYILEQYVQKVMERGGEFIKKKDGSSYKFDSGMCNERGERLYHIAMKIKKEILDKEDELYRKTQSKKKKEYEKGKDIEDESSDILKVPEKYLKITTNNNNNL